jgi:hypothetical protein
MNRRSTWIALATLGLALGCGSSEPGPGIAPPPPASESDVKPSAVAKAPSGKKLISAKTSEISLTPPTK